MTMATPVKSLDDSKKPPSGKAATAAAKRNSINLGDDKVLLSSIELTPSNVLTYNYFGKLKLEHKEELTVYNPTESIVAFKVKCTSLKLIKISPSFGYLKPKGKVTIWVIVNPTPNEKPPTKELISILLAIAPKDHPPNPEYFWNSVGKPEQPFRRKLKIKFVALKAPLKSAAEAQTQNWVDKIKKIKDDDESECGGSAKSITTDDENEKSEKSENV